MIRESGLFKMLASRRNTIFLYMCLGVHLSYCTAFFVLGIIPLGWLNSVSAAFYILFIIFAKDKEKSEKSVVSAYFEIIAFSMVSEIFTRGTYGFIFFILGMIPVIFYLAPSYTNKRFTFMLIGIIAAMIVHNSDTIVPVNFFADVFEKSKQYAFTFNLINLLITLSTVIYTSFFYEVELEMLQNELVYNSTHDKLTGLYNRLYLYDAVERTKDNDFSVAILDIDNFKKINDSFGHDTGDDILVAVSSCLSEEGNNTDMFSVRWGGEEFVMYYKITDIDRVHKRISEVCRKISEKAVLPDGTHVTVTAGLSFGKISDFQKIIKKADDYLYIGKQNGKNRIIWHKNEWEYENKT